ncbi:MAG: citrate transporter [Oscillospiraceae bacterium]|nr:citrate transporter [Oscillospiraceae bacterium]
MNIAIPRPHRGELHIKEHALGFFKAQPVLVIAFILAVISAFVIPPDAKYKDYCNTTVLIQLFGLMIAVSGVRSIGVFDTMTGMILKRTGTVRRLGFMLMLLCFFMSMLVTNDVVLLTFVPLTLLIFKQIPDEKSRILTLVLETAAANLGSMLTPVGNPQNLYLYDHYAMDAGTFLRVTLPAGLGSLLMLSLLCLFLPKTACEAAAQPHTALHKPKALAYTALFAVCLCCVFRLIPPLALLCTALAIALLFDRSLLKKVDYSLLVTFVCFFVFVGNIARIGAVSDGISHILAGREVLVSAILSQGISNVPAAMMLSGFTDNGTALLLGVNLGGLGTMIASMASLISFQFYRKAEGAKTGRYFAVFSAVNFGMLAVLLIAAQLIG